MRPTVPGYNYPNRILCLQCYGSHLRYEAYNARIQLSKYNATPAILASGNTCNWQYAQRASGATGNTCKGRHRQLATGNTCNWQHVQLIARAISSLVPSEVVEQVFDIYCRPMVGGTTDGFSLDKDKVCRFYGDFLLAANTAYLLPEFLEMWQNVRIPIVV